MSSTALHALQDKMHQGRVCQLNYGSGGLLKQETSPAAPCIIPFSISNLLLCIGQEVSFRLRHFEDRIEAVDLQHPSASLAKSEKGIPLENASLSSLPSTRAGTTSSRFQFQIRRFQRRGMQFGNAARAEQLRLVLEAEMLLRKLLDQADLDGDSLCRLVRRCASWLHAPMVHAAATQIDTEARPVAKEPEDHWNLQRRVRKLLIKALSHLDLSDDATLRAVEAALLHVRALVEQLKPTSRALRSAQWLQLRELVMSCPMQRPQLADTPLLFRSESLALGTREVTLMTRAVGRRSMEPGARGGYLKCFAGSVYEPSDKIQALRTIFQAEAVKVKCSECSFLISTSWRFQHPKTRVISILVPSNGHNRCQRALKTRCFWQALGETRAKADVYANLAFCRHDRLLMQCAPCGGKMMCQHGRQRYQCKDCGGGRICQHEKRKDICNSVSAGSSLGHRPTWAMLVDSPMIRYRLP